MKLRTRIIAQLKSRITQRKLKEESLEYNKLALINQEKVFDEDNRRSWCHTLIIQQRNTLNFIKTVKWENSEKKINIVKPDIRIPYSIISI